MKMSRLVTAAVATLMGSRVIGQVSALATASATTRAVMAQLRARTVVKPANGKTLVTSAVAGNQHDLGIRLLALDFQLEGWRSINLGTDMPAKEMKAAALKYQPDLVILSAALSVQLPALEQAVACIKDALAEKAFILIGGRALSGLDKEARLFGANATGTSLEQARDIGQRLLAGMNPG